MLIILDNLPDSTMIDAILPVYTDCGDDTLILMRDGKVIHYPYKIATVMKNLAKRDGLSIPALRQATSRLIGHRGNIPLRFSDTLLLVPLKMRMPRLLHDRTCGYLNYFAYHDLVADGLNAILETEGGHLIPIYWRFGTTTRHINTAHTVDLTLRQTTPLLKLLMPIINHICGIKTTGIYS